MNADPSQIRVIIQNARQALRRGDQSETRRWAEQAAQIAPELEDAWLLLAAVSSPRESLTHAQRALTINPGSQRAHKAVEWAGKRLGVEPPLPDAPAPRSDENTPAPKPVEAAPKSSGRRGRPVTVLLLAGLVCVVLAFAAWSVSKSSALASIVRNSNGPTQTTESNFALAEISKPTYTPEWTSTPSLTPTLTFTVTPSITPTLEFTSTPLPTNTPLPTDTPGVMEAAIVLDTPSPVAPPTSPYVAPTQKAYNPPSNVGSGTHWIDINLSEQRLYAFEGDVIVNSFLVSTGVAGMATPTGTFKIYARYLYADMHGPGYFLPDVPYTMYFHKSYGIHGTYWHSNFGVPMSHGCVNLSIPDAGWLYNWSTFGTTVKVHY